MKLIFKVLAILLPSLLLSQEEIKGTVSDTQEVYLKNVVITLKKDTLNTIISYALTNEKGEFKLRTTKDCKTCILEFSSLGYEKKKIPFSYKNGANQQTVNVVLKKESFSLDEVIIVTEKPVKIRKDTITFRTKYFTDGTETVAEDLLKKIPGISVADDGTIKIGNKEVEKVMVEGDDFFEKGYKILTKNLPAAPIEEVELLKRYSNNKLLKGIEESDKVALNLKLSDKAKRQWFGNIDLGYGLASQNRYDSRANFLNFGKKNKYYFFTNLNNVGYDATGDINNLVRSSSFGEPGSIGDNQNVNTLLDLSNTLPYFKESRFKFNNAELLSLNAIFNPRDNLKIKTIGFANWDELSFFRNSSDTFLANQTNFTNTEDYTLKTDHITLFGKVDLSYDLSKNENLSFISKYSNSDTEKTSDIIFNNTPQQQRLEDENTRLDQKIAYSNKLNESTALLTTARYIYEKLPQRFITTQNNFTSLFENTQSTSSVAQNSSFNYQFLALETHLLDRKASGNLLEIKIGNTYRDDQLKSRLELAGLENSQEFSNDLTYRVNDTYLSSKYLYKLSSKWSITGDLNLHYINNTLSGNTSSNDQSVFFINPSVASSIEFNDKNKLNAQYSFTRRNATINEVYPNFALVGFRNFNRGTGTFNQLDAANASLSYTLGNWTDNFFATAFLTYSNSFDFFSTNNTITQDFTLNERVLFQDSEQWSTFFTFDSYFKFISSNLKGTFSFSNNDFSNIVNTVTRDINSKSNSVGLELRSGFKGIFNYHIGSTWTKSTVESEGIQNDFTNIITFTDFSFILSDRFNIKLQGERYYFGNLQTDNTYYFADLESQYTFKKNKIILSVSGKNLFNTEIFREFSVSNLGTSTTEYRLLPRYILGKITYRF